MCFSLLLLLLLLLLPLQMLLMPCGPHNVPQIGEWESVCMVTGYGGMPSLKIRPKSVSRHGRQNVYMAGSKQILFNIRKV
jgi:hypothetical protein